MKKPGFRCCEKKVCKGNNKGEYFLCEDKKEKGISVERKEENGSTKIWTQKKERNEELTERLGNHEKLNKEGKCGDPNS